MSERIVVTCYKQDEEDFDSKPSLVYTRSMITDLSLEDVENIVKPVEGYYIHMYKGSIVSFLDCIYYHGQENAIIEQLKKIPELESNTVAIKNTLPTVVMTIVEMIDEDCGEIWSKETPISTYFSMYYRGAGGGDYYLYSLALPILLFLLSPFYNKAIERLIKRKMTIKKSWLKDREIVIVRQKKLLKNISKWIKTDVNNLQIISCYKKDDDNFEVLIRTFTGKVYRVTCSAKSRILEMNEVIMFQ